MSALIVFLIMGNLCGAVFAAEGGGYLAGYENQEPAASAAAGISWWSSFTYIASLLLVFVVVVLMAYYASRFLGGRFGKAIQGSGGRILENLALGPNRSACVVELGGRVFLLGVTEHSITLLREIEDPEEIEELRVRASAESTLTGTGIFNEQLGAIDALTKRIPSMFTKDVFKR
ncbi:hypothetical protein TAMA11512_06380 [Selenomonas sp. TAMA-11512]|uniref:flagellar biosynthetic protein FliO n=1 Tax=Selenomonas sp. TAMA-11512 TaxID=3095337 RepID=UPI00308D747A|nr:hypothetical protein TAMA11512_06380 [Selenomonas sp. TAMA-11512]